MRIALSTSVIQRGATGIARYVFDLIRAFAPYEKEHEFFLFTLAEDEPLFDFARTYVRHIRVPEFYRPALKNLLWHQTHLPDLLREHRIDVVHIPSYRRMLWSSPCPRVVTIHDLAPCNVQNKYDWKRMFFGRVVAKHLSRRQEQIISVSTATARDISTFFGVRTQNIKVVHNGIDHQRFAPADQANAKAWVRDRFGLINPFFLYVARLEHPGKNHVNLIEAFNRFKAETRSQWELAFAGSEWHDASQIYKAAAASEFDSQIRFLGFVNDSDLPRLYQAADVCVYPSLYEGFGFPPLEAMACGCPVIASNRGALGEVLGQAAHYVIPECIPSIAAALSFVAGNPRARKWLTRTGLAQAAQFDWKNTAAATLHTYLQLGCRSK